MVETCADANNIFNQKYQIQISYTHHRAHGYFGLKGIGNVVNVLPNPLVVTDLLNLATSAQEVQNFYDMVHSDMIDNSI